MRRNRSREGIDLDSLKPPSIYSTIRLASFPPPFVVAIKSTSPLPSPLTSQPATAVSQSPANVIRIAHHRSPTQPKHATSGCHLVVARESCVLMDYITGYSNIWLCPIRSFSFLYPRPLALFQLSLYYLVSTSRLSLRPLRPPSRFESQYVPYIFYDYQPSPSLRRRAACRQQVHSFVSLVFPLFLDCSTSCTLSNSRRGLLVRVTSPLEFEPPWVRVGNARLYRKSCGAIVLAWNVRTNSQSIRQKKIRPVCKAGDYQIWV